MRLVGHAHLDGVQQRLPGLSLQIDRPPVAELAAEIGAVGDGPADGTGDDFSCVASNGMGGTMPCDPNPYVTWNTTATASWMNIVGRIKTNGAGDIVDSLLVHPALAEALVEASY